MNERQCGSRYYNGVEVGGFGLVPNKFLDRELWKKLPTSLDQPTTTVDGVEVVNDFPEKNDTHTDAQVISGNIAAANAYMRGPKPGLADVLGKTMTFGGMPIYTQSGPKTRNIDPDALVEHKSDLTPEQERDIDAAKKRSRRYAEEETEGTKETPAQT